VRVSVIGVGTRQGDDAAGLAVAESLARRVLPPGTRVATCERPLPDLLDLLAEADAAVLVDAARCSPDAARHVGRSELLRWPATSSHGVGVAEVIELAEALGRAPHRLELVAVGGGAAAIEAAAALVEGLVRGLAAERS
jgi:hydrogenase maturation protease